LKNRKTVPLRLAAAAVAIVAFLLVPAAQAGSRSEFQAHLARALHARHVSPGRTGAIVLDLQTGAKLFVHNPLLALRPASNEKLATTYAALTALGPSFRIDTDVLGDGQQDGVTWQGNLVLKGYGDPALSFAQLNSLARQVAATGIKHVSGRILGDESWFDTRRTGLGWKPDFYLHESPALSALVVNRGWTGRYETRLPALMAAQAFRRDLRRAGVTVHGGTAVGVASAQAVQLGEVASARIATLVRHMDVFSLPIAGETGTLVHRMRMAPARGLVRAKTGTTSNSSALSGFVGDRYVFSVVENGSPVRVPNAEESQNRFAQVLAGAAAS
jgi:D-alanyl-D-alanine carboxypeptidase